MELYKTQRQVLKHLNCNEYIALKALCRYSKDMYNIALYNVRQHFFNTKQYLSYNSNYHLLKENEVYKLLGAKTSQNTMKQVDFAFKSFFALAKKKANGNYSKKVKMPKYLEKDGYYPLIFDKFSISKGYFKVYMSKEFENLYGSIKIKVPSNLENYKIKYIKIIPIYDCQYFEIQYTYLIESEELTLNKNNVLGIDIGVNNLCTCVTNNGYSFIIDGRPIKSMNQYTNKEVAYYKSIINKQGLFHSKRINALWFKRNNFIDDYLNKSVNHIIKFAINNDIGTIVLGYNDDFQQNTNMGKVNNQNFVNIPFSKLISKLEHKCSNLGITFLIQEESYTSKASFLDEDDIPTYEKGNNTKYSFSGNRVKRGLYKTKDGIILNADVNGALNIIRKAIQTQGLNCLISVSKFQLGNITSPSRIKVA